METPTDKRSKLLDTMRVLYAEYAPDVAQSLTTTHCAAFFVLNLTCKKECLAGALEKATGDTYSMPQLSKLTEKATGKAYTGNGTKLVLITDAVRATTWVLSGRNESTKDGDWGKLDLPGLQAKLDADQSSLAQSSGMRMSRLSGIASSFSPETRREPVPERRSSLLSSLDLSFFEQSSVEWSFLPDSAIVNQSAIVDEEVSQLCFELCAKLDLEDAPADAPGDPQGKAPPPPPLARMRVLAPATHLEPSSGPRVPSLLDVQARNVRHATETMALGVAHLRQAVEAHGQQPAVCYTRDAVVVFRPGGR